MLVSYEGTQLAISCRISAEFVNYAFPDRHWLSSSDVAAMTLNWSSLQNEGVPPLPQALWHHTALIVFLSTEDSPLQVVECMRFVQKQLSVVEVHLVVLCSMHRPLYHGAAYLREKAP